MSLTDDLPAPGRLNFEPVFKWNCNTTEIAILGFITFPICLVIGVVLGVMLGKGSATLMFTIFGTPFALWFAGLTLGDVKRERPNGFYQQLGYRWVSRIKTHFSSLLGQSANTNRELIEHEGSWDVSA